MLNRRNFLKTGAAALPLAAAIESLQPNFAHSAETIADVAVGGATPKLIPLPARLAPIDPAALPWQQNIRRVGQSNMTEHDPAVMNIEEWADYWHSAGADIVFVSVTGILAFYPSKVKFHRHGKFLHGRDFLRGGGHRGAIDASAMDSLQTKGFAGNDGAICGRPVCGKQINKIRSSGRRKHYSQMRRRFASPIGRIACWRAYLPGHGCRTGA